MGSNPTRGSSFSLESDCLGCVVLHVLCFVVCMSLLASFFLLSAFLINKYNYGTTCT